MRTRAIGLLGAAFAVSTALHATSAFTWGDEIFVANFGAGTIGAYATTGATVNAFRMQRVAYFFGISSERQLCEGVYHNLAYRWFCRLPLKKEVPDHSSLTRIRDRYGAEIFESVCRKIVEQCKHKGLVKDSCRVMTDATLIAADASLNSLVHNGPGEAQKETDDHRLGCRVQVRRTLSAQLANDLAVFQHAQRSPFVRQVVGM
jgi:transposase